MNIRAAVLESVNAPFRIREVELSPPQGGEVLVRVAACGVCHSDWHVVTGDTAHPLPAILGHEGAGVIEAIGAGVSDLAVGDHVALNWAPACGRCFYCLADRPSLCATYIGPIWAGTMQDGSTRISIHGEPIFTYCALGAFAERTVVPAVCCVPLPKSVPFDIAAVIGCAVTTGVGSVMNTAKVPAGRTVAVFGAGGIGLSTVMGAVLVGSKTIIAVDPLESRRNAALDLGATHAVPPDSAIDEIRALTEGRGADYVFEAVGIPRVQEQCLVATRPGGTVVFSGLAPMGTSTNLPGAVLVREEKTVMGSYYGTANPPRDFVRLAREYEQGRLPLDRFISRRYALDEINEAYADMLSGRIRRGVITF